MGDGSDRTWRFTSRSPGIKPRKASGEAGFVGCPLSALIHPWRYSRGASMRSEVCRFRSGRLSPQSTGGCCFFKERSAGGSSAFKDPHLKRRRPGAISEYSHLMHCESFRAVEICGIAQQKTHQASRRRSFALGCAAREVQSLSHQSPASLFAQRRVHEPSRGLLARLRRMVDGQHHHVSPQHLHQYAAHAAWMEDHRRLDNGALAKRVVSLAMARIRCLGSGRGTGSGQDNLGAHVS